MDVHKYENEMQRLIAEENTYRRLKGNPVLGFKREMSSLIQEGFKNGIINKEEMD